MMSVRLHTYSGKASWSEAGLLDTVPPGPLDLDDRSALHSEQRRGDRITTRSARSTAQAHVRAATRSHTFRNVAATTADHSCTDRLLASKEPSKCAPS
jgi:hypothetical protein